MAVKPCPTLAAGLILAWAAASAGEVTFSAKPSAAKAGDKLKISFTISAPTDVEVAVLDSAGKFLRPRKADDPKDAISPFAKPEIAFAWIIGLAVTDKYAYVDDVVNKRVLRVKLGYAAEETAAVP